MKEINIVMMHKQTDLPLDLYVVEDKIRMLNRKNRPKCMILSRYGKLQYVSGKVCMGHVHSTKIKNIQQ